MKVTFEFYLPEDERDYEIVSQAHKALSLLSEFSQQLRLWQKYAHDFTSADDALIKIRDKFYQLLKENEVDIDL
jgi:hypothetical protein